MKKWIIVFIAITLLLGALSILFLPLGLDKDSVKDDNKEPSEDLESKKYYLYVAPETIEGTMINLEVNDAGYNNYSGDFPDKIELKANILNTIYESDGSYQLYISPTGFGASDAVAVEYYTVYEIPVVTSDYYVWLGSFYPCNETNGVEVVIERDYLTIGLDDVTGPFPSIMLEWENAGTYYIPPSTYGIINFSDTDTSVRHYKNGELVAEKLVINYMFGDDTDNIFNLEVGDKLVFYV